MTAINATRCDQAIRAARKNGKRKEEEIRNVQFSQAFHCTRQAYKVTPAECHDCFNTLGPSLRLATNDNRQRCIEMHTKIQRKDVQKGRVMSKPEKSKTALTPAKVEGENELKIKPGQTVAVVLEKGQEPVKIKVTKEMAADRHAALNYAENATRNKSLAEIQLCVAVALYLGEGEHAPWVIDGFQSPREASQTMFGWSDMKISYRKRLGQAFINQYGKENVLQKASEIGISKIPYHKLREFLQAPKHFEQFLNTGHFEAADGNIITVDEVLENPVGQLPLLFERFTEERKALPETKEDEEPFAGYDDPNDNKLKLSEKEHLINATFIALRRRLDNDLQAFLHEIGTWPEDAVKIIEVSSLVEKSYEEVKGILYAIHNTATMATYDPEGAERMAEIRDGEIISIPKDFFKTEGNKK